MDALQHLSATGHWLLFHRTRPVKIEVYSADEDFEVRNVHNPLEDALNNSSPLFSSKVSLKDNDLLCVHASDGWQEFVRFDHLWAAKPDDEHTSWDYYLKAKGRFEMMT